MTDWTRVTDGLPELCNYSADDECGLYWWTSENFWIVYGGAVTIGFRMYEGYAKPPDDDAGVEWLGSMTGNIVHNVTHYKPLVLPEPPTLAEVAEVMDILEEVPF